MLSGEETHTKFIVFALTRSGLKPTIYHTRGEHANHINTAYDNFMYQFTQPNVRFYRICLEISDNAERLKKHIRKQNAKEQNCYLKSQSHKVSNESVIS